jgi:hypothetical protein
MLAGLDASEGPQAVQYPRLAPGFWTSIVQGFCPNFMSAQKELILAGILTAVTDHHKGHFLPRAPSPNSSDFCSILPLSQR